MARTVSVTTARGLDSTRRFEPFSLAIRITSPIYAEYAYAAQRVLFL